MAKGPFSAGEDELLLRRAGEWGHKGVGLWRALEVEMGRPSNNLGNRYKKLIRGQMRTGRPKNKGVGDGVFVGGGMDVEGEGVGGPLPLPLFGLLGTLQGG
ncbi:hypothetical protein B484DRAFT_415552, partial [Ochromonadaceae sp. CCMP2298]